MNNQSEKLKPRNDLTIKNKQTEKLNTKVPSNLKQNEHEYNLYPNML